MNDVALPRVPASGQEKPTRLRSVPIGPGGIHRSHSLDIVAKYLGRRRRRRRRRHRHSGGRSGISQDGGDGRREEGK